MEAQYGTTSQEDLANSYATLPGQSLELGFVTNNMTEWKSRATIGREPIGCHPTRWMYELLNNQFTICDLFNRARQAQLEVPFPWQHQHRLVVNGNQNYNTASNRFVSTVCMDCHFHFNFNFEWDESKAHDCCNQVGNVRWPMQENMFPWHHFAWVSSEPDPLLAQRKSKYNPILAREYFVCTALPCTFQITLDVSEPRLGTWWVNLLRDKETILEQMRIARKKDPDRYPNLNETWAEEAPLNLNTYLKNLIESDPEQLKNISKRNKRFAVIFGPRCFELFKWLEFEEEAILNDGIDEGFFAPKAPGPPTGPNGSTELGTYRSFIEDVRQEVECLIYKAGQTLQAKPVFVNGGLHTHLGCKEVTFVLLNGLAPLDRYKLLGVMPNQSREIIVNAYYKQWNLLPSKRRELIESLMGIANDSGDEKLSHFAITQSSVFESQIPKHKNNDDDDGIINQALIFLGMSPPNNHSANAIINAYRTKISHSPDEIGTAQNMLMLIAQASGDMDYQSALWVEATGLTLATSRAILGIDDSDHDWENYAVIARTKLQFCRTKTETTLYLDALDTIAEREQHSTLKAATCDLRAVFLESSDATILLPRESEQVNYKLPVGLHNIGNTCYLNSLLQYLYTVKVVRDIVMNYEDYKLELDDEVISKRRIGGNRMQMDRAEAVVAQAFVRELRDLFKNLKDSRQKATRPSQRLANAVLLSTRSILEDVKRQEVPIGPKPPPLPARKTSPTATDKEGDVIMADGTGLEHSETASNDSSQTLVEQQDISDKENRGRSKTPRTGSNSHNTTIQKSQCREPLSSLPIVADEKSLHISEAGLPLSPHTETLTIDQKVLGALEHQHRSSGTDQQDVEEVIGSIINRLQAAIRPSVIDSEAEIQLEKIMETFFVTTVNYTKKFDEKNYQHETSFDRSITAFPAIDGSCSLYDALGRNFDQQAIEEDKLSRYTAIKSLPPILHVLIQRSQTVSQKNNNPVVIPETLYLDRFMDAPHDSVEFKRRATQWARGDRLADLKKHITSNNTAPRSAVAIHEICVENFSEVTFSPVPELVLEFDGPNDLNESNIHAPKSESDSIKRSLGLESDDDGDLNSMNTESISRIETLSRTLAEKEMEGHQEKLNVELEQLAEFPYRLQAVICHRGHLSSGHYWVWIHDFEEDLWRSYNDSEVIESRDTKEVLNNLSNSGEPYYLCYVRDSDKESHVDVPKRDLKADLSAPTGCVLKEVKEVDMLDDIEAIPPLEPVGVLIEQREMDIVETSQELDDNAIKIPASNEQGCIYTSVEEVKSPST